MDVGFVSPLGEGCTIQAHRTRNSDNMPVLVTDHLNKARHGVFICRTCIVVCCLFLSACGTAARHRRRFETTTAIEHLLVKEGYKKNVEDITTPRYSSEMVARATLAPSMGRIVNTYTKANLSISIVIPSARANLLKTEGYFWLRGLHVAILGAARTSNFSGAAQQFDHLKDQIAN